mmetsp:Transcript_26741/g.53393  ORF Transcript_26741/g.53393 Transcript_26741/m.53393 type:complete len:144 (+) Transcript_26741:549-980(+)
MCRQRYFPIHRCKGANIFINAHLSIANQTGCSSSNEGTHRKIRTHSRSDGLRLDDYFAILSAVESAKRQSQLHNAQILQWDNEACVIDGFANAGSLLHQFIPIWLMISSISNQKRWFLGSALVIAVGLVPTPTRHKLLKCYKS